ncbi:MAG: hypothetical protein EOO77_33650, partial [Oxalobacteraceae bacterium]
MLTPTMVYKGNPYAIKKLKFGRDAIRKAFPHHLMVESMRLGRFTADSNANARKLVAWIASLIGPPQNWYDEHVPETQMWASDGHSGFAFRTEEARKFITDRIIVISNDLLPAIPMSMDHQRRHEQTELEVDAWVEHRRSQGEKIVWIKHLLLFDDDRFVFEAMVR